MTLGKVLRRQFRPTNIPAAIAALVVVACGVLADRQNSQLSDERSRAEVLSQVSLIRAKLEGDINGDTQLVRGLVSRHFHRTEHYANALRRAFGQPAAESPADQEHRRRPRSRRGHGISLGRERGGDRARLPQERAAARGRLAHARQRRRRDDGSGRPRSGRQGLHHPLSRVHRRSRRRKDLLGHCFGGHRRSTRCTATAASIGRDLPIDIVDHEQWTRLGKKGSAFSATPQVANDHPVVADVSVPSGSWRISATPKGGWDAAPSSRLARAAGHLWRPG